MNTDRDTLITEDGWRRLHEELRLLRQRRDTKADDYRALTSTAPDDPPSDHLRSEIVFLNRRIAEIEELLSRAKPIDDSARTPGVIGLGSRVNIRWEQGEEESYTLVGPSETHASAGYISYQSPVGRALLGKRKQDSVEVITPDGARNLIVMNVE